MINLWHIKSTKNNNECDVDFFIDFEFKSLILNKMIGPIFEKATNKMIEAFENRAQDLFSPFMRNKIALTDVWFFENILRNNIRINF